MATVHNFRPALNGFNREDVVHYIEFINNRNKTQLDQMQTQLRTAQNREQELLARIDAEQTRVRELEAYRRAEQAERLAKERAQQIYDQANAVLSDAAQEATIVADDIANLTDKLTELLSQYRASAQNARDTFQKAAENLQNTDK